MVLLHSKKLLLLSGTSLIILLATGVYFLVISNDNNGDSEVSIESVVKSEEEIASLSARNERFESLAEISNSSDSGAKLQASLEFARSADNNTTSRLDAYRLCIQVGKELNDAVNQEACFAEALILAETLQKEADKTFWIDYINDVNSGVINKSDEADDGNQ